MAEAGPQAPGIPAPPPPPQAPQQAQQTVVHLRWSDFKPEFSGKPEEDVEAHLLWTNDWMDAHHFLEGIKVQRFDENMETIVSYVTGIR